MNIEILRFVLDFGLIVLIWMVQLLIYPGFQYLDASHFKSWHSKYARNMGFIAAPLMIAQVAMSIFFFLNYSENYASNLTYAIIIALTWITTFVMFVPLHNKLDKIGYDKNLCKQLTKKNWIRVVLWTAIVVLDFQLLYSN